MASSITDIVAIWDKENPRRRSMRAARSRPWNRSWASNAFCPSGVSDNWNSLLLCGACFFSRKPLSHSLDTIWEPRFW